MFLSSPRGAGPLGPCTLWTDSNSKYGLCPAMPLNSQHRQTLPLQSRAGCSQEQQWLQQLALTPHKSPQSSPKPLEENTISLFTDKEKEDPEKVSNLLKSHSLRWKSRDLNPTTGLGHPAVSSPVASFPGSKPTSDAQATWLIPLCQLSS